MDSGYNITVIEHNFKGLKYCYGGIKMIDGKIFNLQINKKDPTHM